MIKQKIMTALLDAKDNYLTQVKLLIALHGDLTLEILNKHIADLESKGFLRVKTINGLPGYELTEDFVKHLEMFEKKEAIKITD